jgi:glycosyltransferase involved in cell wall biosynthesis
VRFLLLPMRFPVGAGESYLTTELADALVEAGHEVDVLQLDWDGEGGRPSERLTGARGVPVLRVSPRSIGSAGKLVRMASKFWLSARRVGREARRAIDMSRVDAVIAWAPAVAFAPVIRLAEEAGVRHRILFIWDFFPDHHIEIGRIPRGPAGWLTRAWEQRVLRRFTTIFCTLPANAEYLRRRFRLGAGQRVRVAPVWTVVEPVPQADRQALRRRHGLPEDRPIAVFGGQLGAGRGMRLILDAAKLAVQSNCPLAFLFVGDGALAAEIDGQAARQANLYRLPAMAGGDYRALLTACEVGLAVTVPGVSSFSTPSKTLDYLKAGLPVAAALEPGSEFAALLQQRGVGRSVEFGDAAGLAREAWFLSCDAEFREGLSQRAYNCLADVFSVRHAVCAILDAVAERDGMSITASSTAQKPAWVAK